ncbi:hypothetical protein [Haloarchaeobius baliensis]
MSTATEEDDEKSLGEQIEDGVDDALNGDVADADDVKDAFLSTE